MMRIATALLFVFAFALASSAAETTRVTITPGESTLEKTSSQCTFTVKLSSGRVLGLDFNASGIASLADDTGVDLGKKPAGESPDYKTQPAYSQTMGVEGGKGLSITILAPKAAGTGARSLDLDAKLKLKVGLDARQGTLKNIALAKGTQFILGGYEARVTDTRKTAKSTEFAIEFAGASAGLHVHDARLIDADGKTVLCTYEVTSSGSGEKLSYRLRFGGINQALEKVGISYLLIADAKLVDVPFKIKVPVKGSGLAVTPVVVSLGAVAAAKTTPAADIPKRTSDLTPVGKYAIKVDRSQPINEPCHVSLAKPLKVGHGERYIISLVPASKPDTYWGWWKEAKNGATRLILDAPREVGSYELRLGRVKAPAKTYSVLQRVKVIVK